MAGSAVISAVDLSQYQLVGRYNLPEPTRSQAPANNLLAQEASAVTYNWDTDSLFVLGDGGTAIVQVSKLDGSLIDTMTLAQGNSPQNTDFYDPEGLAYIGNGQFVMVEERYRQAVRFSYAPNTTLARANAKTVKLGTTIGNIGLEGIGYDPATGGYVLVKEISPEGIFQTSIDFDAGTASNGSPTTVNSANLFDPANASLSDFADIFALSNLPSLAGTAYYETLLILSQEQSKIVAIGRNGSVSSSLQLQGAAGVTLGLPDQQTEGLTMDRDGKLYIVSENGGGDIDHPQLWIYAPSSAINQAPSALSLTNQITSLQENTSTATRIKVADLAISDDGIGTNNLSLTGPDAAFFEVDSNGLFIKAGTSLDFEAKASYLVTVTLDDPAVGATPDASASYGLTLIDQVNENAAKPILTISEVAPWSSGNSPVAADWFEVTNSGISAIDISGWKFDDNSDSFSASVALSGISSIGAGESVIFIETGAAQTAAGIAAAFLSTWFGTNPPPNLKVGNYSGSGVGLSTGGDKVNLFNASGLLQASVTFGASPAGPNFPTFNNAAALNNATITTLSAVGTNGAAAAVNDSKEIGSPGSVGKLFVSEVAPWSSGNSPVGADWFELTNSTASAINISGWKIDDNSGSPVAAVALNGITSIGAGESVIFVETGNAQTAAAYAATFINTWFGGTAPAGLQIGSYSGSSVGLGTSADAVNIYNAANVLQASVDFGASPTGTFASFDNASALNNATLTQLSTAGTNGAFIAAADLNEIGSPGTIVANPLLLIGTPGNDSLVGGDRSELINGAAGNDTIAGGAGNDSIYGGAGADVAVFDGTRAAATISRTGPSSWTVTTASGGTDVLKDVELLQFSDGPYSSAYSLQILHYYGESGLLGTQTAPIMGALIDRFDDQYANTLVVAEGDSWIPGPWLVAGADPSLNGISSIGSAALGRADVAIMNLFGTAVSALGNHEYDLGSPVLSGAFAASGAWKGAQFPFITSNLDFSADSSLKGLADVSLGGNSTNAFAGKEASDIKAKIAPYAVVTRGGEKIGVVGATTWDLLIKSSPNGTKVKDDGNAATSDLQEVAAYVQAGVDQLIAAGVNKIVMVDQLDGLIDRNKQLAPLLRGVDVMVAGGGHERLGDSTDTAASFNGHDANFIAEKYPIVVNGADGKPTLIVTTDTEYSYLGRLVVDFDAAGNLLTDFLDPIVNGAYASTATTLQAAYGSGQSAAQIIASSTIAKGVAEITSAIDAVVSSKDGTYYGYTNVYLEGDRVFGRAQEVNLGDISADANLYAASRILPAGTLIGSLKNGGGIRASIGSVDANGNKLPPAASSLKPAGAISQLDIENALRFDNKLMVFDVTSQGLLNILEYAAGLAPGNGGYIQIGGVRFSFDPSKAAGQKVQDVAIYNQAGTMVARVADNGSIVSDAPSSITLACLNFTANGGDGYPIKANATNFRYILTDGTFSAAIDKSLDFAAAANIPSNVLGEQDAFKAYLTVFHSTPQTAYSIADTAQAQDQRIQNLSVKATDTVLAPTYNFSAASYNVTEGTAAGALTNATVRVTRSGDTSAAGSVVLNLNDGTAKGAGLAPLEGKYTGPSTATTPYVIPAVVGSGVAIKSLLTVGDAIGGYKMAGIPDGLGAFDNGNGTFTLLMNHEIGSTSGVTRAHGGKGAFVSSWVINKSDLTVQSGADLIQNVFNWDSTTQASSATANNVANGNGISFNRFCSADLAGPTAFYNSGTGLGSQARILLNGEEGGSTGYALANVATGTSKGNSYVLGKFNLSTNGSGLTGVGGWENLLANPFAQDKTVVIGNNDGGSGLLSGALAVYVGTKTNSGSEADKAGLTNGVLKFVNVSGNSAEIVNTTSRATNITTGTRFTLSGTASTTFSRPEDGLWDPKNPSNYYFVTTDRIDQVSDGVGTQVGNTRLWRLKFDDITNPDAGGSIDLLVDGDIVNGAKVNMFDNISIDNYGRILLQEDVGGSAHNGKIYQYDIATDSLKLLAKHDPARFGDVGVAATAPFTNDEETSGIIDMESILGAGWSLFVDQAHYTTGISSDLVEGGQLIALFNPDTYQSYQPDFINTPQVVSFAAGESFKDVSLPVYGDTRLEEAETVNLILSNPSAGSTVGSVQPRATFTISDLNPTPTDILLSKGNLDENVAAGSLVGSLSAASPISGDSFSFALVTGSGDTDNAAFTIAGNQLKISTSPDFESKSTYSIRVRTAQEGGQAFEKVFSVSVNDLSEGATITGTTTASVKEGKAVNASGLLVASGTLGVSDPDAGQAKFKTSVAASSGNLGSLSITELGAYTYTLANGLPAVQNLSAGQSRTDTFTVQSFDGSASKDIVVTINGANAGFNAVAAGDPTSNRVTLWTRSFDSSDSTGRTGISEAVSVQVARDTSFSSPVFTASGFTSGSDHDYTLKLDATGLQADTTYYYRFQTLAGELSSVGTFQTAPLPTSDVAVRIGHSGDVDGLMRPYPLMVDLAAQKFDVFIFNGDTIYETVSSGSAATPATKDAETGAVTQQALLDAYHRKYLENLLPAPAGTYPSLKEFYASQANFTAYDNHELGNKAFINGGAPYTLRTSSANGSANTADDVNTTGQFINDAVTFDTLQQAYLDYQPIRTPDRISAPGDLRSDGELKLYGTQQFGQNAQVFNLDTRTFRDVRLNKATGGDDTGVRADNPNRTLLGATQKAWLKQSLLDAKAAGVTWKFINITDPIDMIGAYGSGEDSGKSWWGGYRAERNEILKFIADNNIKNVVFLASDDHQGRINELTYLPDSSLDPTKPGNYKVLDGVFSIVDGPMGATGPDTVTDHSFSNVKALADALAAKQTAAGLNPIGLSASYAGLFNVYREGDSSAASNPKPVDFYTPDTNNYVSLDVSPAGVLTVTLRGINSYAANSFPEPSAANAARTILSFSIDGNPVIAGASGDDTNIPGISTIPDFTGTAQTVTTGSGNDELDVALVNGHDNRIFTGSGADTIYAGSRDVITGGSGDDWISAEAGDGNRLSGMSGNDDFIIGTTANRALGGAGNDIFTILGEAGTNYLNGGAGADQFWLIDAPGDKPAAKQYVMDFSAGEDKVGLRGFTFADLSFSQVGADALLSVSGTAIGHFSNTSVATLNNQSNFLFS